MPPAPTVPSRLDTKPGRRGSPLGGFEAESEPGARSRSPGVLAQLALRFGFPAGSPSGPKPWRFAARQIRNRGSVARRLRNRSRSSVPPPAGSPLAEASGLPWQSMDLRPGTAASQLPGRNPVLPDDSRAEAPSSPVAARRLASRFPPDRRRTEVRPCLDREPEGPRPGHFTKPATLASAQGQARSFRMAAASSAARAFTPPPHRLVGQEAASLRLWLGRLSILRSIVSATGWKLSWNMIRTKRIPTVDNEDNGHK